MEVDTFSINIIIIFFLEYNFLGLPRCTVVKKSTCQFKECKRHRFSPWVRKIPGGGNGNPLQYPCLENSMGGGAWWVSVLGVAKSQTWLSDRTHTHKLLYDAVLVSAVNNMDQLYLCKYPLPIGDLPPPPIPQVCSLPLQIPILPFKYPSNAHLYHLSRFHVYMLIYDICFSLSDLLYSVW